MDYRECLERLAASGHIEQKNGLQIHVKPVPETDRPGVVDPRAANWFRNLPKGYQVQDYRRITSEEVQILRDAMGCQNADLSRGVKTNRRTITTENGDVPILIYTPDISGTLPLICYIHGGGFFGGSTEVVENACRLLAERAKSVVISIDYGLAPEHRFPEGLLQCLGVIRWAHSHAELLNIDPQRIAVSGDSAGGNLSMACCLLDNEGIIRAQLLLYPAIVLRSDIDFGWTWDVYEMNEGKDAALMMVHDIKDTVGRIIWMYIRDITDTYSQLLSPWQAPAFAKFPPTFLAVGEYDYLRQEAELFCQRLVKTGIPVAFFRYQGMGHAFFEHTGEFPQAEDCTNEMADFLSSIWS